MAPLPVTHTVAAMPADYVNVGSSPMCGKTTICKYALILVGLDNATSTYMTNQGTEAGLTAAITQCCRRPRLPMACDDMPWNDKVLRRHIAHDMMTLSLHSVHAITIMLCAYQVCLRGIPIRRDVFMRVANDMSEAA